MTRAGESLDVETDILIVGAGFAGLAMAIRLKQAGMTGVAIIEKGHDVGGTWRDNTYPGAACDIPSHLYSLSFEPKADWSRMYPGQAELRAYLDAVADKHGLRDIIRFDTAMRGATWDAMAGLWRVALSDGASLTTRVLISAIGALHEPAIPTLPGLETFQGTVFHSARWDHAHDLAGKRVAVIGTGASAIQFVPKIAPKVAHLSVFQRTAPWINPKKDYPIGPRRQRLLRYLPLYRRFVRARLFCLHEVRVFGFLGLDGLMRLAEKFALEYLHRKVGDPTLRAKLTPNYRLGCKRVLISSDYYPALQRDNVELVTADIAQVRADRIVTRDGAEHVVDTIIHGTGFKVADIARHGKITGLGGRTLAQAWAGGTEAYWGLCVGGFPNYFMMLGPNTGLGHNSVVLMIEAQARFIASALTQMRGRGLRAIDVKPDAMRAFNAMVHARMARTVWRTGGCKSWYLDEAGRNVTLWPGSVVRYSLATRVARLADFVAVPMETRVHG
jgi:cation diffusion facilitator CzcD-associated flavoprotein CzcO